MPNEYRLVYTNKFGEINDKDWLNRFEENYYDDFDEGKDLQLIIITTLTNTT